MLTDGRMFVTTVKVLLLLKQYKKFEQIEVVVLVFTMEVVNKL